MTLTVPRPTLLLLELKRRGITQRTIAFSAGIPENRMSAILRGWVHPTPVEVAAFDRVLDGEDVARLLQPDDVTLDRSTPGYEAAATR